MRGNFIWALFLAVPTSSWLLLTLVICSDGDDKPAWLPLQLHPFKACLSWLEKVKQRSPCQEHRVAVRMGSPQLTTLHPCSDVCLSSISEIICPQHDGARSCPFISGLSVGSISMTALWGRHADVRLESISPIFPRIINNNPPFPNPQLVFIPGTVQARMGQQNQQLPTLWGNGRLNATDWRL